MSLTIPLFPLNTVLFPGGVLPLRIFEPRYLDMISRALREGINIGVVLIKQGREVGNAATTHTVGTLCDIAYWNRRPDGLLGITLRGCQRFRILNTAVQPDQLIVAEVEAVPNVPPLEPNQSYQPLTDMVHKILNQLEPPYTTMPKHYDDLEWVSARLCELLPIPLFIKQELLCTDDVYVRLQRLTAMLQQTETA